MRGCCFDLGDLCGVRGDALEHRHAELVVRHFAAAEAQRHLDLVALLEELEHLAHLHVIVVIVDVRTHLDLFDLLRLLALALLVGLFLGFIFEAADVEELGDGRIGAGADLDQVEADAGGLLDRFACVYITPRFSPFSSITRTLGTLMN